MSGYYTSNDDKSDSDYTSNDDESDSDYTSNDDESESGSDLGYPSNDDESDSDTGITSEDENVAHELDLDSSLPLPLPLLQERPEEEAEAEAEAEEEEEAEATTVGGDNSAFFWGVGAGWAATPPVPFWRYSLRVEPFTMPRLFVRDEPWRRLAWRLRC